MQTRRTFVKQVTIATSGLLLTGNIEAKKKLYGLQLFTVRNELPKNLEDTLAKVAQAGYNSVEVFGYDKGKFFGKTPEAFLELLKKNGLQTPSGHYMMLDFLTKGDKDVLKENVDVAARMGHKYVVIPYLFDNMRTSLDDYKRLAEKLNTAGQAAKASGLELLYHNHNFEFKDWGGQTGFDVFRETDASLVGFEIDFYWVARAGLDPLVLIKENKGRIKVWHVKDMIRKEAPTFTTDGEQLYTEVGTGVINYKEIFRHKKESGMDTFFIEQDQTNGPVYASITKSLSNVKKTII